MIRQQLQEFCSTMGIDNPTIPCVPEDAKIQKAVRLVGEEFCEFLEGVYGGSNSWIEEIKDILQDSINFMPPCVDLAETADALADTAYVVESAFQTFGMNSEPIIAEVHRTNMAKAGGPKRADGKQLKPDNWMPPDIINELVKQGAFQKPNG